MILAVAHAPDDARRPLKLDLCRRFRLLITVRAQIDGGGIGGVSAGRERRDVNTALLLEKHTGVIVGRLLLCAQAAATTACRGGSRRLSGLSL